MHLPTIASRHPLWDEHDEEDDPNGARILDQGRFTFSTTWLDGVPYALAQMPKDTIKPLLAALGISLLLGALVYQLLWVVLGAAIATLAATAIWLYPTSEGEEA